MDQELKNQYLLTSEMLITKLPTMHFEMIGLDNKTLWVVGS